MVYTKSPAFTESVANRGPRAVESIWKQAASRLGIPFEAYRDHRLAGRRWCCYHQAFEDEKLFYPNPEARRSYCIEACKLLARPRAHDRYYRLKREKEKG